MGRPLVQLSPVISEEVTAQAAPRIADRVGARSLPSSRAMCLDLASRFRHGQPGSDTNLIEPTLSMRSPG
jgi:hypothetical protein